MCSVSRGCRLLWLCWGRRCVPESRGNLRPESLLMLTGCVLMMKFYIVGLSCSVLFKEIITSIGGRRLDWNSTLSTSCTVIGDLIAIGMTMK